jgi:hypothetical protein
MNRRVGSFVALLAVIALLVFTSWVPFTPLSLRDTVTDQITRTLAVLVFMSVITERAVAVFTTSSRQTHDYAERRWQMTLRQRHLDWVLGERGSIPEKEWSERYSEALKDLESASLPVQWYDAETERIAVRLGLAVGLLLAAVGVRALAPLLAESPGSMITFLQRTSFNVLDIALTGAVIGGGSKGVRSLAQTLLDIIAIPTRKLGA